MRNCLKSPGLSLQLICRVAWVPAPAPEERLDLDISGTQRVSGILTNGVRWRGLPVFLATTSLCVSVFSMAMANP